MTAPILLDMTRAVWRRLKGDTPSGIDRVCDAYAVRFSNEALAVLQLRGRMLVLNRKASNLLFGSLERSTDQFRRTLLSLLAKLPWLMADRKQTQGAIYLNVSHTDFDLDTHWGSLRARGLRPVYLLHDLIPITHPEVTTRHKIARHRGRVVRSLESATGIIVNSHATEDELRDFADQEKISPPNVLVAPIAGANLPISLHPAANERPAFVSVGTIETRKNHALLLRAWSQLVERMGEFAPLLVLAGSWGLGSEHVRAALESNPSLSDFVEVRTGLDDRELARLVAGAQAILLPTLAEGYGLPMVEALQMRVPVIASDLPSFREIGQGIPTLLDHADVESWVDTIIEFCENGEEKNRQLAAMNGFQAPTWRAHFVELDRWLADINSAGMADESDRALPAPARAGHNASESIETTATSAVEQRRDREAQC